MAIDAELLSILVCPDTREPVRPADDGTLNALNERVGRGGVRNRGGRPVTEKLLAALVRADGKLLYPVRDDIPVMLLEEAIPLD
jgi:uncharacterized protein YbaR (Trm112 family)